jgi:hypothetical protein
VIERGNDEQHDFGLPGVFSDLSNLSEAGREGKKWRAFYRDDGHHLGLDESWHDPH